MAYYYNDLSDIDDPATFIELTDVFSNIVFNCLCTPEPSLPDSTVICGVTPMNAGDGEEIYLVEVEERDADTADIGGHMFKLIVNLSVLFYSAGLKPSADERSFWITLTKNDLDILIELHKETTLTPEIRPDDVIPLLQ